MPTTADHPKCYARVRDRRILDWNLEAFSRNGIDDICFIGGYQIDVVRGDYPHFTFRHNTDWENNNILESLMVARDLMDVPFICCYSDTLFTSGLIAGMLQSDKDITLSVDTGWEDRYEHRTEHPPDDAEKVTAANGRVTRIHREIDPAGAYGEYTGIARFSVAGADALVEHYGAARGEHAGKPYREAAVFEKAYVIHLLQDMIEKGVVMHHADTAGQYMEIDTQQDFELAQTHWQTGDTA